MLDKLANAALIVCAGVLAALAISRGDPSSVPYEVGTRLPHIELIDSAGDSVVVDLRNPEPTLLVFFSTTCRYCLESLPAYATIAREHCSLKLVFAILNLDGAEMGDWWETEGSTIEKGCAAVSMGRLAQSPLDLGVTGTPTHFLVRSGRIRARELGALEGVPPWLPN